MLCFPLWIVSGWCVATCTKADVLLRFLYSGLTNTPGPRPLRVVKQTRVKNIKTRRRAPLRLYPTRWHTEQPAAFQRAGRKWVRHDCISSHHARKNSKRLRRHGVTAGDKVGRFQAWILTWTRKEKRLQQQSVDGMNAMESGDNTAPVASGASSSEALAVIDGLWENGRRKHGNTCQRRRCWRTRHIPLQLWCLRSWPPTQKWLNSWKRKGANLHRQCYRFQQTKYLIEHYHFEPGNVMANYTHYVTLQGPVGTVTENGNLNSPSATCAPRLDGLRWWEGGMEANTVLDIPVLQQIMHHISEPFCAITKQNRSVF